MENIMVPRSKTVRLRACIPLTGLLVLILGAVGPVHAQDSCADVLEQATIEYETGAHESAVGMLLGCVNSTRLPSHEVVPTFRLLIQAYLELGDEGEAKMALLRVLGVDAAYEPDPVRDSRAYGMFVDKVKRELFLPSAAASRCDREMAEAQAHYDQGAHEQTIGALIACLEKPEVDPAEAVRAHRMIALTHLRRGALADARGSVVTIFENTPSYEADPVRDLPAYVSLVAIVRQQLAENRSTGDIVP